jgi:membrane protein DedA with SNARE-associated domain
MVGVGELISRWGYFAIVFVVTLGNVGLPVPEESILVLSGYLAWRGELRLSLVIVVGIISAVIGDNIGFWIGRKYGRRVIERYGPRVLVTPERLESASRFVSRYGAWAVFVARFMAGLRFLAGPLAGAAGLRPSVFAVANVLGAIVYVPCAAGIGFAVGYGLGEYVERFGRVLGTVERVVMIGTVCAVFLWLVWRARRAASPAGR